MLAISIRAFYLSLYVSIWGIVVFVLVQHAMPSFSSVVQVSVETTWFSPNVVLTVSEIFSRIYQC